MDESRFRIDGSARERDDLAECTCQICRRITVASAEPVLCDDEHVFCLACIQKHIQTNGRCPVDGAPLVKDQLRRSQRVARFAQRLPVRCSHHRARARIPGRHGCRWRGTVERLADHEASECAFRRVRCARCGAAHAARAAGLHALSCGAATAACAHCAAPGLSAREMDAHLETCPALGVPCPHACLVEAAAGSAAEQRRFVLRRDLDAHVAECAMAPVACAFAPVGCDATPARHAVGAHMRAATQRHMLLLLAETLARPRADGGAGEACEPPAVAGASEEGVPLPGDERGDVTEIPRGVGEGGAPSSPPAEPPAGSATEEDDVPNDGVAGPEDAELPEDMRAEPAAAKPPAGTRVEPRSAHSVDGGRESPLRETALANGARTVPAAPAAVGGADETPGAEPPPAAAPVAAALPAKRPADAAPAGAAAKRARET